MLARTSFCGTLPEELYGTRNAGEMPGGGEPLFCITRLLSSKNLFLYVKKKSWQIIILYSLYKNGYNFYEILYIMGPLLNCKSPGLVGGWLLGEKGERRKEIGEICIIRGVKPRRI